MHTIIVSSPHAIYQACMRGYGLKLYIDPHCSRAKTLIRVALQNKVEVVHSHRADIMQISAQKARFAALSARVPSSVDLKTWSTNLDSNKPELVLVLDHILDPQNFGAVFRTASHFNIGLLITASIRSAFTITDSVLRSSAGAAFAVPFAAVKNIGQALRFLKRAGFWIYGADMQGKTIWKESFPRLTAIVVGSEGEGLSYAGKKNSDIVLSIPGSQQVESLNVSVAAGIFLYEVRRSWQQG